MIIYPAIDLKAGRVVRLQQGRADAETVYEADAAVPAQRFLQAGAAWVHVVDLDGAFTGEQGNRAAVEKILATGMKVELGGGIRSVEVIEFWLSLGVDRVIIGTQAVVDPDFMKTCLKQFPAEKLAVGIDARGGKVAVRGWVEVVELAALDFARDLEQQGVRTIIYTDISRDGMLSGPNFDAQEQLLTTVKMQVIASGGVSRLEDVERFRQLHCQYPHLNGVISGKALYDGRMDLAAALAAAK